MRLLRSIAVAGFCAALLAACDTGISGTALDNTPPETALSVRDSSLVDNLAGADRLASTVAVSWTGTDPDGFVAAFEIRFYPLSAPPPGPEADWRRTTAIDTLILLPIPRGERAADVVFEVRAVDNEDARDPTPARTVFPVENAPPTVRLTSAELPPDTTFTVASFAWTADDPEGRANLSRVEVSLNDSTAFVPLAPDVEFITLVADLDGAAQGVTEARVFLGKSFQQSEVRLPGLRLDADNTFYLRAVDLTDTTSVLERYTWYVKQPRGGVLFVNDFRKATFATVQPYHFDLLRAFLPEDTPVDTWDLSMPFVTGAGGNAPRSTALPNAADPTLRQTLALFEHIYWLSSSTTNSTTQNNLPFAANVLDLFFEQGGKLMVHTPVSLPSDPNENIGNAAVLLLPISDLITFPDSLRPTLRMPTGTRIEPTAPLPGVGTPLPALESQQFIIGTLPYRAEAASTVPLYRADFISLSRQGGEQTPWMGPETVASISADRRIGLFALPLVNETSGAPIFTGTDGDPEAPRRAIHLMLESLGFPQR